MIFTIKNRFTSFQDFFDYKQTYLSLLKEKKKGADISFENEQKEQKFKSHKVYINDDRYDSEKEVYRHYELIELEKQGLIQNLRVHQKEDIIILQKNPTIKYIPDFVYDENGYKVIEDMKGMQTPDFILKKKMLIHIIRHSDENLKFVLSKKYAKECRIVEEYTKAFSTKPYK